MSATAPSPSAKEIDEDTSVSNANLTAEEKEARKAAKKAAKEAEKAEKAAKAAARLAEQSRAVIIVENGGIGEDDYFGDLALVQSKYKDQRVWTPLSKLTPLIASQQVWLRGRVHTVRRTGKLAFILLRRGFESVQCVVAEDKSNDKYKEMVKFASKISGESIVDVLGIVNKSSQPITSASQSEVEIQVVKLFVVSLSQALPFQLDDASQPEPKSAASAAATADAAASGKEFGSSPSPVPTSSSSSSSSSSDAVIRVGQDVRLDNRWIDLRTPANHAIFKIQSRVGQYFRQYFIDRDFVEIHTPKIIPGASEGGAAVFRLDYFGTPVCLAQSPQQHKQMAVMSDLFRVFEIGPVFRAEDSNTHRHCTEFTGMDFEMEIKQHYHELLEVLGGCLTYIFDQVQANCQAELAAVNKQYPFEPLKYGPKMLVLSFKEAVAMLRGAGVTIGDLDDFSTPQEKKLGELVKQKYGVDLYIVDKYPKNARPFYTMPCPEDPNYTNSYDVFVRGEEITSGSQRVHDVDMLKKRAAECGIPESSLEKYVESFKYGSFPHGGAGIGMERVVMLFLGLDNIRKTSMFPRTPGRCAP